MKNWMGQEIAPGAVVTKGGNRDERMRIGVVLSVNEEEHTAKIKWEFAAPWWGNGEPRKHDTYGKPGNCLVNYLMVIDPAVLEALR